MLLVMVVGVVFVWCAFQLEGFEIGEYDVATDGNTTTLEVSWFWKKNNRLTGIGGRIDKPLLSDLWCLNSLSWIERERRELADFHDTLHICTMHTQVLALYCGFTSCILLKSVCVHAWTACYICQLCVHNIIVPGLLSLLTHCRERCFLTKFV